MLFQAEGIDIILGGTSWWNILVKHVGGTIWWRGAQEHLPIEREAGVRRDASQHRQLL